jgi:protein AATF/BFR2
MINPAPTSFDPEDDIYPDTAAKVVENDNEVSDEDTNRITLRKRNIDVIDSDERYDGAKVSRKALRLQGSDTFDKFVLGKDSSESEDACTSVSDEESDDNQEDIHNNINGYETLQPRDNEDESIFQHISSRSLETEVERGIAVRNQLNLWDNLLECRIQLQKALTAGNKLPQYNIFEHFVAQGGSKYKAEIQQTKHKVTTLLENLVTLQTEMLKSYPETRNLYKTTKNECSPSEVDEICSDTGEEEEENDSSDDSAPQKQKELDTKHHNLEYYAELLSDRHKKYSEYRNATIQKWNDKTRVLVGKLSSRNFSNFEHSTLKQIEQILSNRQRLIQRSQLKRQSYVILGQELVPQQQQQESTEEGITSINANNLKTDQEQCKEYYAEIYDDTDCYHQLLRELIERKSSDITDPVQLGRQWLELQKLRSKMKRKIDTRATKGRKIRYVVHSKLVNYMAPVSQNLCTEEAKTELFRSLFGNGSAQ